MKRLACVATLLVSISASAATAGLPCSIHPAKGTPASALPALAKIALAEAQSRAIASLHAPPASTSAEGELEVEHGCLVYSFDVRVRGRAGIEEVMVDPGNGKVLSHKHESARQEAAERAKEKTKPGTP